MFQRTVITVTVVYLSLFCACSSSVANIKFCEIPEQNDRKLSKVSCESNFTIKDVKEKMILPERCILTIECEGIDYLKTYKNSLQFACMDRKWYPAKPECRSKYITVFIFDYMCVDYY